MSAVFQLHLGKGIVGVGEESCLAQASIEVAGGGFMMTEQLSNAFFSKHLMKAQGLIAIEL